MRPPLLSALCLAGALLHAQGQTRRLGPLEFTLPAGAWTAQEGSGWTSFTRRAPGGASCRITVVHEQASQGSLDRDADGDWAALRARHPQASRGGRRNAPAGAGWTFVQQTGSAPVGGASALLSVHTFTGQGRHLAVEFESTHGPFDTLLNDFINACRFQEPAPAAARTQVPAQAPAANGQPTTLVGKWKRTTASYSHWGLNPSLGEFAKLGSQGYSEALYDFQAGGAYTFVRKVWPMAGSQIYYFRESGSWKLDGEALTVTPRESVSEAWSKRSDDKDLPDRRERVERHPLKPTRYRAAWHFWAGPREWNLALAAEPETARDGSYAGNGPFPRGWYYKPADPGHQVR